MIVEVSAGDDRAESERADEHPEAAEDIDKSRHSQFMSSSVVTSTANIISDSTAEV